MKPTLLVLAAGLGSRYGGLKQMDRLGPGGESIIDYSVFDAARAGFGKVVFVLREEIVDDFYRIFANRYKKSMEVDHVIQRLEDIPPGINLNPEREKPWGTCHAVLSAAGKLSEPFAVINGDDFYGYEAFQVMHEFLVKAEPDKIIDQAMVGYVLRNTLSDHGYVSRGICVTDGENYLTGVTERTHIEKLGNKIVYINGENTVELSGDETVSMNFWGFTPAILEAFSDIFTDFMKEKGQELKSEFYIPYATNILIEKGIIRVKVLESDARWFGVTYSEDKEMVMKKLVELTSAGKYPSKVW
jgi:choline kinase